MKKRDENLSAQRHASFTRRNFLRGLGACIALPAFESFRSLAAAPSDKWRSLLQASVVLELPGDFSSLDAGAAGVELLEKLRAAHPGRDCLDLLAAAMRKARCKLNNKLNDNVYRPLSPRAIKRRVAAAARAHTGR